MIRQLLIGGATAALVTGSASALTMNVSSDNRSVFASASAGGDFDQNSDSAAGAVFSGNVSASAQGNGLPIIQAIGSGGGGGFFGSVANASAGQNSEIGALSISGSGFADASGNHGDFSTLTAGSDADGSGGGGGLPFGAFKANSNSLLDILFSIDAAAKFDLSGYLSAGNELSDGPVGNDIFNSASVILINTDTNESAFKLEANNSFIELDETGEIGPGNYRFTLQAIATVDGAGNISCIGCEGFTVAPIGVQGYSTSAGYKGVNLGLTAIDKPIPEPVTTTLAAMGLGALALRTSRRRHA